MYRWQTQKPHIAIRNSVNGSYIGYSLYHDKQNGICIINLQSIIQKKEQYQRRGKNFMLKYSLLRQKYKLDRLLFRSQILQYIYIFNATSQIFSNITIQNEEQREMSASYQINSNVYKYYKSVDFLNDNILFLYTYDSQLKEINKYIYIHKQIYGLDALNIYSYSIYDNALYLLYKDVGLCYSKKYPAQLSQFCWNRADQFDVFSLYIEPDGLHCTIIGSKTTLEIFQTFLYDDEFQVMHHGYQFVQEKSIFLKILNLLSHIVKFAFI